MTRELTLRSLDIPTVHKFALGFDNMFDELLRLSAQQSNVTNYPPYNVIKTGDETLTIEMAVAGFAEGEIDISINNRVLTIKGEKTRYEDIGIEYLHRGISSRNFTRDFTLGEYVEVLDANVSNGILTIYLERKLPEEKKPKQIAIKYNK